MRHAHNNTDFSALHSLLSIVKASVSLRVAYFVFRLESNVRLPNQFANAILLIAFNIRWTNSYSNNNNSCATIGKLSVLLNASHNPSKKFFEVLLKD